MNEGKASGVVRLLMGLAIVGALVFTIVGAGSALADKGGVHGHGGGGGGGGSTPPPDTATCDATPNPISLGSTVTIDGSGFPANITVGYSLTSANGTNVGWLGTDDHGNFSLSYPTFALGNTTASFSGYATCSFEVN